MYRKVKITKGSSGWGGPLVLEPNETCNKVMCDRWRYSSCGSQDSGNDRSRNSRRL